MMVRKLVLSVVAAGSLSSATAQANIMPDNNLYLEDVLERESNVTKEEFEGVIAQARTIFAPVIGGFQGTLAIRGNWDDSTVNASATQLFGSWIVNMYGGLARRPEVTLDGFTLVLCHEIGHHLAGFPFVSNWGANEGQSDYYATGHCAQMFWGDKLEENAKYRDIVPAGPKALCNDAWSTEDAQNLCYRGMMGGKSLADLLGALKSQTVDFATPDTAVVSATDHAHPKAQCRLDTYMAGALCGADYDKSIIPGKRFGSGRNGRDAETESASHYCAPREELGTRPLCWFKPGI